MMEEEKKEAEELGRAYAEGLYIQAVKYRAELNKYIDDYLKAKETEQRVKNLQITLEDRRQHHE